MKLLLCPECGDVVKFRVVEWRSCDCGASSGRYLEDGDYGEVAGKAIPLGINNRKLLKAIVDKSNPNNEFVGWVFNDTYYKLKRVGLDKMTHLV